MGCVRYALLWIAILFASVITGLLIADNIKKPLYWTPCIITLCLVGIGIYWDREDYRKSPNVFFLNVLIWLFPALPLLLLIQLGFQNQRYDDIQSTRIKLNSFTQQMESELNNESVFPLSQQRPAAEIIQNYLNQVTTDPWGRPYHFTYPATRGKAPFDLFSAGPDGVYGNADDIGNW